MGLPKGNWRWLAVIDARPAAGEPFTHGSARRASPGPSIPGGTPAPRTEGRRWTAPAPEPHLGFRATKGNTCSGRTLVVLLRPTRCRILDGVVRLFPGFLAEKTGGSRPWTRVWPHRIEPCSPNGRPCRTDPEGSSLALPMGVCEGHIRGAGCASPGIPTQGCQWRRHVGPLWRRESVPPRVIGQRKGPRQLFRENVTRTAESADRVGN